MSSLILTIDNAVSDTTLVDRLYDVLVGEGVQIPVEPPNFIYKDDLEYSNDRSELDNLLRRIIKEISENTRLNITVAMIKFFAFNFGFFSHIKKIICVKG